LSCGWDVFRLAMARREEEEEEILFCHNNPKYNGGGLQVCYVMSTTKRY